MGEKPEKVSQVAFEISGGNVMILTESKTLRDDLVFKDEVLDKVKFVSTLEGTVELTVAMAATYYDVPFETVKTVLKRHRQEFNEYAETRVLKGASLSSFKARVQLEPDLATAPSLTLISRRGLLRIGMLLTESQVAESVRNYLLNVEEVSDEDQRAWAIEREISKRERRKLTDAIQGFYNGSLKGKGFEYSTFTNLVYKVLWDLDANGVRQVYGLDKNDPIRDSLSTEDLRKVVEVESAISSLVRLNKDYRVIRDELIASKDNFR